MVRMRVVVGNGIAAVLSAGTRQMLDLVDASMHVR